MGKVTYVWTGRPKWYEKDWQFDCRMAGIKEIYPTMTDRGIQMFTAEQRAAYEYGRLYGYENA